MHKYKLAPYAPLYYICVLCLFFYMFHLRRLMEKETCFGKALRSKNASRRMERIMFCFRSCQRIAAE